jgi:hydroxypyruvate isomerase
MLLTLPLAASAPLPFRLSVRVEAVLPGLSLDEQMHRVAEAGYQGFEFGDWRAQDPRAIAALKNRLGLICVSIVGNRSVNPKGMGLCDPAERDGFLAEIRASAEAAKRFEARQIVVLSGYRVPGLSRHAQRASIVEGLKRAHDIVAPRGIAIVLEPINTLAPVEPLNPKGDNHANYFLDRPSEAFSVVGEVGSPFVKVLFDLYHAQIMEGNLIETIRGHMAKIGHIHVADVPGRHEPGTGEINFANVFRAIRDSKFAGFVGMEYVPLGDAVRTLIDVRQTIERL